MAGNLPYNISSPILFRLLRAHRATAGLVDATVMLQREVAERIQASPGTGDYGVLADLRCSCTPTWRRLLTLPPGAFRPAPKVHSAVLRLTFRAPRGRGSRTKRCFEAMVRSMFTQRRKMLGNALRAVRRASAAGSPATALAAAGIDRRRRPETLQLAELARLAEAFVHG